MGDGVEVKLDVNQLITQLGQAWEAVETSSETKNTLCRGGKVIGTQEGIHWDSLTGWEDEQSVVITTREYSNRGSRLGIWDSNVFDVICTFQKGGGVEGHGKFLQNVGFMIAVKTAGGPGTGGTVDGFFDEPVNRGTKEDPIAELTAHVTTHNGNSSIFHVTLNGATGIHVTGGP